MLNVIKEITNTFEKRQFKHKKTTTHKNQEYTNVKNETFLMEIHVDESSVRHVSSQ